MADRDEHTEPDRHEQRRRRTDFKRPTAPDFDSGSRSPLGRALDLGLRLREIDAEDDAPAVEPQEKDASAVQAEESETTPPGRGAAKRRDDVAVIVDSDDMEDRYQLLRELRGLGRCVGLEG